MAPPRGKPPGETELDTWNEFHHHNAHHTSKK